MWLAKWVLGTDKWCTCCFRLARCIRLFCCAHRLRSASWARSHAASTARSSRSIAQEMTRVGFHKLSNHRRSTTTDLPRFTAVPLERTPRVHR